VFLRRVPARTVFVSALSLVLLAAFASPAPAPEVRLSISKAFGEKVMIALAPFEADEGGVVDAEEVLGVIAFDLKASGYFSFVENRQFLDELEADDRASGRIDFQEWMTLGGEVLIKGAVTVTPNEFSVEGRVYDLGQGRPIFGRRYSGPVDDWRAAVHDLSDDIVRQLTGEAGFAGSKIAYVSNVTGTKEIYIMDYDGANRRRITRDSSIAMYPDWFPDETGIVYTRYRGRRQETYRVSPSGGEPVRLTSFPGLNAFAAVSPRGNELLMSLSRDGNPEIYRLTAAGGDPRRLTYSRSTESSPCWSPDGRRVAFVSDRSGSPQIYVMSATGGNPERITYQGTYNTSPDWSPRGDLVAYITRHEGIFQICTVDVSTKEVVRLTTGSGHKEDPSWAPDGRHLVYTQKQGGKSDLYLLDIYDLEPVRLTSGTGDYLSPAWSQ